MTEEGLTIESDHGIETNTIQTEIVPETKPEDKSSPTAVPLLSKEEADALIEKMKQEESDFKKRGLIYYQECFLTVRDVSGKTKDTQYKDIQETPNWIISQNDIEKGIPPIAKKQDGYFIIKSNTPLKYSFVFPLSEYSIYSYTLSACIKGKGSVVLSEKNSNLQKEFKIDSQTFETVVQPLGDASTFSQGIIPNISFSGDLQIESITIQQQEQKKDRTVCLGTIEAISKVPDIKKAEYPDCFYTALFTTKEIFDGAPIPETIQLLIPAFRNSQIDPLSKIMKKGNWKIAVYPLSSATEKEQEIEQVDELESYEFTPYILVDATTDVIPVLHSSGIPILEGKKYFSPYEHPVNPPIPDKYLNESRKIITQELKKVEDIIASVDDMDTINSEFQESWDKKQKQKEYESVYPGYSMLWIREKDSFFSLPKNWVFIHPQKVSEDNLQAIIELDRFFKSQGVVFILQIVPDLYDIAALSLNPEFQKYGDQQSAAVVKQLLESGVEAQYISDEIVKHAFEFERLFFYPSDFHPLGATDIMTAVMAKRLELFRDILPKQFSSDLFTRVMDDTVKHWPDNTKLDIGDHQYGSIVQVPHVYYDGKLLYPSSDSKILVFGNSFVPSPQAKGTGFVSYLAEKILYNSSERIMGGVSGLTGVPQLFLTDTQKLLKGKQIAILPVSIKYFMGEDYKFTNVKMLDTQFKKFEKATFLSSSAPTGYSLSIFPSTIDFKNETLQNYFFSHTGLVSLSKEQPEITIPIPDGQKAKTARISIQPNCHSDLKETAIITINDHFSCQLVINWNHPNWEIINYEIQENTQYLTIKLNMEKSSKGATVFIHNISFYE